MESITDDVRRQLTEALSHYEGWDGEVRVDKVRPVPRPDYEAEYGGPYSHILNVRYCEKWGCVFGLRTDGQIILWAD